MIDLRCGDSLSLLADLPADSVDSIITDPPYGLGKNPDMIEVLSHWIADEKYDASGGGFMGKAWDSFVPGPAYWKAAYRVAKPGATLLAFGGTRTVDLLSIAIRLGRWEKVDQIEWVYGQGFSKSHNISKAIDKKLGRERKVIKKIRLKGGGTEHINRENKKQEFRPGDYQKGENILDITEPASEESALWSGWGTALKPAHETILVFRKPVDGTFAENALAHGVAGLWIDGCRIEVSEIDDLSGGSVTSEIKNPMSGDEREGKALGMFSPGSKRNEEWEKPQGRWPANFIYSHHPECKLVGYADDSYQINRFTDGAKPFGGGAGHDFESEQVAGKREIWDCHADCPTQLFPNTKSGKPGVMRKCVNESEAYGAESRKPGTPMTGFGDDGSAARFFYCAKASTSERNLGLDERNPHPTVKPLELMRYLCRLTKTPTGGVVLDPFMGSCTTGMAAVLEGRDFIGFDITPEYVEISRKRIAWAEEEVKKNQLPMFPGI